MPRPTRLLIVAGSALVALLVYVIAIRPALAAANPMLLLAEFPIALVVAGALLWLALRETREPAAAPPEPWSRHEQIVRPIPDPETARLRAALETWVERGERADEAASVLASAAGDDPSQREALRERLAREMAELTSARKRESFLHLHARPSNAPENPPGA